jgi:hypothetical protein
MIKHQIKYVQAGRWLWIGGGHTHVADLGGVGMEGQQAQPGEVQIQEEVPQWNLESK